MDDYLIVDGYNVINNWPQLMQLKKQSYSHARDKLIEILMDYHGLTGTFVVLVFDAQYVKGGIGSREYYEGVEIIYTREDETADMFIERLVGKLAQKGQVGVATSDWAEQRIVFGRGAYRVSARELQLKIEREKLMKKKYVSESKRSFVDLDARIESRSRDMLEKWRRGKTNGEKE